MLHMISCNEQAFFTKKKKSILFIKIAYEYDFKNYHNDIIM